MEGALKLSSLVWLSLTFGYKLTLTSFAYLRFGQKIWNFETNMRRRSYHAVANVVDDAGNKCHATRLCCNGTRVFCGEVNWLRRESGRQLIPFGRRLGSYHGSDGGLWSWSSVLVIAATTGAVTSVCVWKISIQTCQPSVELSRFRWGISHITYFLKNIKILKSRVTGGNKNNIKLSAGKMHHTYKYIHLFFHLLIY